VGRLHMEVQGWQAAPPYANRELPKCRQGPTQ
jgi:hypothetical protein